MRVITLPRPGVDQGPCVDHCLHQLCSILRSVARHHCLRCLAPIGYDRPFHMSRQADGSAPGWVHVACGAPLDTDPRPVVPSSSEAT